MAAALERQQPRAGHRGGQRPAVLDREERSAVPCIERVGDEIPPGGMDVPPFQDTTTGQQHDLRVLWPDQLRWQGLQRALALPDRPDLADPHVGGPSGRRLALEGFDEACRPT